MVMVRRSETAAQPELFFVSLLKLLKRFFCNLSFAYVLHTSEIGPAAQAAQHCCFWSFLLTEAVEAIDTSETCSRTSGAGHAAHFFSSWCAF